MRVPLSWLREMVPIHIAVDELVLLLGSLGTPVESVTEVGGGLDGVVVARVLQIDGIAGADKIRAVTVDAGTDEPVSVVCGAWNFDVGHLVPLATVGTVLPGDFTITRRKMKGVTSDGMLCAPDELGLPGGDHSGILLLPEGLAPGTDFAEAMGITRDVVLELEINPNRPDAMSVVGVARDVAAALKLPFTAPAPSVAYVVGTSPASVEVLDVEACPRFTARVITGVTVGPSPAWLANRLTLAGMRPINNVVDISNYVMLELGHPNHAYDLAALPGRGLRVRRARDGETLVTLDEVERRFSADDLLICDAKDSPVGVAGVMGGASSEINDATTELLLETATFDPMTIAWTSKRLALRSEASARFEKGVDPLGIDRAVDRFCELLVQTGAVATTAFTDVRGELPVAAPVRVRTARVNGLLGTDIDDATIKGLLDPIGFATEIAEPGQLDVVIPGWRPDSSTEIDVVEEVARMHGYANITPTVPTSTLAGRLTDVQRDRREVRAILTGVGVSEAWTTTFLAPGDLERCGLEVGEAVVVANPLAVEESLLRTSLLPGLLRAIAYNESHRLAGARLFEIGNVFRVASRESLPDEREMLGVALAGADATEAAEIWSALAGRLFVDHAPLVAASPPGLHPTRSASAVVTSGSPSGSDPVGVVGEVDPAVLEVLGITERVAWLEIDLMALLQSRRGPEGYRPISRYPSSDVDLSFEVDGAMPAADVAGALRGAGLDIVVDIRLIDTYRGPGIGEGRRSVTYRVRLQAPDRTLTDEELGYARQRLIDAVQSSLRATLRA